MLSAKTFRERKTQPSGAWISECETYRYLLWRVWEPSKPMLCYILLNPSTADHEQDDPTMTRCIRRARDLGYGGMWVANLFALRSTDPKGLYSHPDPVGPMNNETLQALCKHADAVLCGWGNHGVFTNRGEAVTELLRQKKITPQCLRLSAQGQPVHPLYQPYGLMPQDFVA